MPRENQVDDSRLCIPYASSSVPRTRCKARPVRRKSDRRDKKCMSNKHVARIPGQRKTMGDARMKCRTEVMLTNFGVERQPNYSGIVCFQSTCFEDIRVQRNY